MPLDFTRHVVLRWSDPDPAHVPLLVEGGVNGVLLARAHVGFQAACAAAGIETATEDRFHFASARTAGEQSARPVIFAGTLWPGIQGRNRGDEATAAASDHPWVDSNAYWPAYLRALYPRRFPVLSYAHEKDDQVRSFRGHELALLEAWTSGAGAAISPEPRFRQALLKGEEQARETWRGFARASGWVREHAAVFRRPPLPTVTVLVEPGDGTVEIANLAFRHGVSPALAPAADPPPPDPARILTLVAVELQPPAAAARARILSHAEMGATVVVNGAWWRDPRLKLARKDVDRDFYALGRGRLIAYREAIGDPGDLAFDVIDAVTQERRAARLWNAPAAIAMASPGVLRCLNYGRPGSRVLARLSGNSPSATLLRPEAGPMKLKVTRRGSGSEVVIPELRQCAVLVFG